MRLHPDDIEALAQALARAIRSGTSSASGIGAPGQGDQCDEESDIMDHTNTEDDGELSALEQMAREDVARLKRGLPLRDTSRSHATRRKASR